MKNVYITSYCQWNSFGSVLQSIGLQRKLEMLGFAPVTVKPEPPLPEKYPAPRLKGKGVKPLALWLHKRLNCAALARGYQRARAFLEEQVRLTCYGDYETLARQCQDADAYVAGSDQIWNPGKLQPHFFLDFVEAPVPRVAYAASMGVTCVPPEKEAIFRRYLGNFTALSVREQDNAPVIQSLAGIKPQHHVDPVFLLSALQWQELERPYSGLDKPYFLVYPIYWDPALNAQLKELHRKTGIPIVAITDGMRNVYANKRIYDAGAGEFLWLLRHAQGVVSSSFHAIAMSVIFHKRFCPVINPAAPSRLEGLMDTFGVKGCTVSELAEPSREAWDCVDAIIRAEAARSTDYLWEALNGTCIT